MIRVIGNRRAFTLLELLVVVAMIAVIMAAMATSVTAAQERARVQKATTEVKVITQAILAYEDWSKSGLPEIDNEKADANGCLKFLFGKGGATQSGQQLPTLLQAAIRGDGLILDPWGHPYMIKIKKNGATFNSNLSNLNAGYYLPNFYRVSDTERKVIW